MAQTVVACPTCSRKVAWNPDNAFRPFCSERCKQVDLGAWASNAYSIPAQEEAEKPFDDSLSGSN
jgi:endogenous inhibitor of DNA gyrase (YacG/DUF329 family)